MWHLCGNNPWCPLGCIHTHGWKGMKCCLSSSSILPVMISVTSITVKTEEKRKVSAKQDVDVLWLLAYFHRRRPFDWCCSFWPSKSLRLHVVYGGSKVLMKVPLLRCHFTQLLGEKFFLKRWRGRWGGWEVWGWCFSPSHFKNLFDVEADSCTSSHIHLRSHMPGENTPLKTTSKSEGCLYTLSDYNTNSIYCTGILGI